MKPKEGKEFYVSEEDLDKALHNSIEIPYDQKPIPSNRFGEDPITVFAVGDEKKAQDYGAFLKDAKINEMPIYIVGKNHVDKPTLPFARKLWLRSLDGRSELDGDNRNLHNDRSRGVK
ncbi:hypothetical protein COU57_05800 [Candidatus Pacearchaeota archaeon CG10_big_fil_rev_8_21_14_0_10_32_14]|nr:MAG: hypothetical protein COU57_05800 [Candidatus Pacearchaeota archaeon CG10_big_fil_rev_8_21_14_0_10_32_14]